MQSVKNKIIINHVYQSDNNECGHSHNSANISDCSEPLLPTN